ncbi:hypothetical protein V3481_007982 [Fusarium oxysporum f. sp. vasinfectum]
MTAFSDSMLKTLVTKGTAATLFSVDLLHHAANVLYSRIFVEFTTFKFYFSTTLLSRTFYLEVTAPSDAELRNSQIAKHGYPNCAAQRLATAFGALRQYLRLQTTVQYNEVGDGCARAESSTDRVCTVHLRAVGTAYAYWSLESGVLEIATGV